MQRFFCLAIAILISQSVLAQSKLIETWRCYATTDYSQKRPLAVLSREMRESGVEFGTVSVAGVKYTATFKVAGFDRRWDFESYKYAFIIKPDGSGSYYDFTTKTEGVTPSQVFKCVMS